MTDEIVSIDESKVDEPKKILTPDELLEVAVQSKIDDIIPWEDCVLPSKGYYYGKKMPEGHIFVRPMNIHAEKMMATQRFAQSGKSIDMMFKQCVQLPNGLETEDLLGGDRTFLLYVIRGITYGNYYEFMMECPNQDCKSVNTYDYDLNELQRTMQGPIVEIGDEPFKVVLPHYSSVLGQEFWVRVRFIRGYDMQNMIKEQQFEARVRGGRASRSESIDETIEKNLNLLITDVMGSTAKVKIQQIVSKMHSRDTAAVRQFLKDNSPGIDTMINIECPSCNRKINVDLPITESFFRPSDGRGTRE